MDSSNPSVHTPSRARVFKSRVHHHHIANQHEQKVRLMCSYGGRFVPRPHDKSLCYVGGDTRIIVFHRHSSLRELCLLLSSTLFLHGRNFIIKYLLPGQDLDSLISIISDEDLHLMIQEYDRVMTSVSTLKPSRVRMFLFFCDGETEADISIHDAKQGTWFVDAINDSSILSRRVLQNASAVDCSEKHGGPHRNDSANNLEALSVIENNKQNKSLGDVNTVSDISLSGSLSLSLGVDDSGTRLKQQQPMTDMTMNQDDGCGVSSAALAPPMMVTGNNINTCDARASMLQLEHARTSDTSSLLSTCCESRIASSSCSYLSQPVHLQDQVNMGSETSEAGPPIQMDKVEESGYMLPTHADQNHEMEQFVDYVPQAAIPCYFYPVYVIPVLPTHPIGASSGNPLTVLPQSGTASTVHNNTASHPAFLQPCYLALPQSHCLLHSNITFAPAPPPGFEYQTAANSPEQTNTPLPPH